MSQIWPPPQPPLGRRVWNARTARRIPAVGRALGVYSLIASMPLDAYRGDDPLPRPRLLDQPDPTERGGMPLFLRDAVVDYLFHGNALHLITARDADGWPLAVRYVPAEKWTLTADYLGGNREYWIAGQRVPNADVVHVRRGTDPDCPARGIGVIEDFVHTFDRAGKQEALEDNNLSGSGVPSVAVIAPQKEITQDEADAAGETWNEMFGGEGRVPGLFPNGTQVLPLSWSPADQQLTLARQMTLTDIANAFNLDHYWVGAPGSSHTYRSPVPLFLELMRTSLMPVITDLRAVWSQAWLPRGQRVRFDTSVLTSDDLASAVPWIATAVDRGLWSVAEGRTYMGMSPTTTGLREPQPVPTQLTPQQDQQQQAGQDQQSEG